MLEFALYQETARTAPLLPLVEGWEENIQFLFLLSGTYFLKKEKFHFPLGSQVHGTTVCDVNYLDDWLILLLSSYELYLSHTQLYRVL